MIYAARTQVNEMYAVWQKRGESMCALAFVKYRQFRERAAGKAKKWLAAYAKDQRAIRRREPSSKRARELCQRKRRTAGDRDLLERARPVEGSDTEDDGLTVGQPER